MNYRKQSLGIKNKNTIFNKVQKKKLMLMERERKIKINYSIMFFFSYEFNIFILEKQIKNNLKYKKHIKFEAYMLIVNQKQKSYLLIKNYKG